MHELTILRHLRRYKQFLGVFASDELPKIKKRPSGLILNLDESNKPGSHWCAVYFDGEGAAEYYDPLGFPPFCDRYLHENAPEGVIFNPHQIQYVFSVSCGEFCIDFLERRFKGESFCEIISSYSKNSAFNDWLV